MARTTIKGYRELLRAADRAGRDSRKEVRAAFKEAGEVVRVEAAARFAPVDARSAAGYRVVVRQRGVAVEQRHRKTTGQHPEFGSLQMREALVPALEAKEDDLERGLERAADRIADHFTR